MALKHAIQEAIRGAAERHHARVEGKKKKKKKTDEKEEKITARPKHDDAEGEEEE